MRAYSSFLLLALSAACATERGPLTNQMAQSSTRYLSRAARQPVGWQPWGRDAFALAARLDRPVLLYVGSDDCRWCVVMDRETYADREIAALIDSLFVPVRVDRDERPDVARRYQDQVRAIAGLRGLPLTVVLTPDGEAFFGGTYFAPDDPVTGRGLKQILPEVARSYHADRGRVVQRAALVRQLALGRSGNTHGVLRAATVDAQIAAVRAAFRTTDSIGGFVATQAIALLLGEYGTAGDTAALRVARRALDALLDSGAVGAATARDDPPIVVHAGLARDLSLAWVLTADLRYREAGRTETRALAHALLEPQDRTVFADREAFAIGALLESAAAIGDTGSQNRALQALDGLLRQVYARGYGVRHALLGSVDGLLEDQVQVASASLSAYEATGERRYLDVANDLAGLLQRDYADPEGGYFDVSAAAAPVPALAERTKTVLDDLLPAGNASVARFCLRLAAVTGDARLRRRAEATLESLADAVPTGDARTASYLAVARLVLSQRALFR